MFRRLAFPAVCVLLASVSIWAGLWASHTSATNTSAFTTGMPVGVSTRASGVRHDTYDSSGTRLSRVSMDRATIASRRFGPFLIGPLRTLEATNLQVLVYAGHESPLATKSILGGFQTHPVSSITARGFGITFHGTRSDPACAVHSDRAAWDMLTNGRSSRSVMLMGNVYIKRPGHAVQFANKAILDVANRTLRIVEPFGGGAGSRFEREPSIVSCLTAVSKPAAS